MDTMEMANTLYEMILDMDFADYTETKSRDISELENTLQLCLIWTFEQNK